MFEVDVKNVTKKGREGEEEDHLRFGVLTRRYGAYSPLLLTPAEGHLLIGGNIYIYIFFFF